MIHSSGFHPRFTTRVASWLSALALAALGLAAQPAHAALAADLSVTMTATPGTVPALGDITYTLTVRNILKTSLVCVFDPITRTRECETVNSLDASGVRVVDALPAQFLSVTNTGNFGCGASSNVVTCSGGSLLAGDSATITIRARAPNAAATLTNSASIAFALASTADRNAANNSATVSVNVLPPPVGTPPGPLAASTITAGNYHTCVTRPSGKTYCWGWNDVGQTGVASRDRCPAGSTASPNCVGTPTFVMNALRSQAGIDHTCALDGIGKAWCWGNNFTPGTGFGQVGVPSLSRVFQPMLVADERIYSSLGAGQYSSCGVSAGTLYCWGAVDRNLSSGGTWQPTPVPATVPFQDVAVGYLHACALSGTGGVGQARCIGSSGFDLFPNVTRLSSKVDTTCAELQNGTVMCAGENGWGQLGNGTFTSSFAPQLVGNGQPLRGVSVGTNHVCAIDPAGQAWCWGNGYWGEFGDGTNRYSATPVRAGGNRTYIAIASGYQHTCAIGTDNQVYCWGRNYEGELGINYIGSWWNTPVATVAVPM